MIVDRARRGVCSKRLTQLGFEWRLTEEKQQNVMHGRLETSGSTCDENHSDDGDWLLNDEKVAATTRVLGGGLGFVWGRWWILLFPMSLFNALIIHYYYILFSPNPFPQKKISYSLFLKIHQIFSLFLKNSNLPLSPINHNTLTSQKNIITLNNYIIFII